jgi:acetate kinase
MKILVLNCGSSSVKFQIIDTDLERIKQDADRCLVHGVVERVGSHALITYQVEGKPPVRLDAPLRDHRSAIDAILRWIVSAESEIEAIRSMSDLHAVGHRVVHGGEKFKVSVRIDGEVLAGIEDCIDLAPLHRSRCSTRRFTRRCPRFRFSTGFHTSTIAGTRFAATASMERPTAT